MVVIVRKENAWAPFAEGLSRGLERFGQMHQQNQQKKGFMKALEESGKYTKEEAKLIANAPEKIAQEFVKQKGKEPLMKARADLAAWESGEEPQAQQTQPSEQQQMMQQQEQPQQEAPRPKPKSVSEQLRDLAAQKQLDIMNQLNPQSQFGQPQMSPQQQMLEGMTRNPITDANKQLVEGAVRGYAQGPDMERNRAMLEAQQQRELPMGLQVPPAEPVQQQQPAMAQQPQQRPAPRGRTPDEYMAKAREFAAMGDLPTSKVLMKQAELKHKEQREELNQAREDIKEGHKESKEFYEKTVNSYKSARESNMRLDRIEELVKGGNLPSPQAAALTKMLSNFGYGAVKLDLTSLLGKDAEEVQKLSADFIKGAKDVFPGGRLTDTDIQMFMQTVPTLLQSNEGKLRVARNMRIFNDIKMAEYDALKQVINENGGKRPWNAEMLVEDKLSDTYDRLAAKFKVGIDKEILEDIPENTLIPDYIGKVKRLFTGKKK